MIFITFHTASREPALLLMASFTKQVSKLVAGGGANVRYRGRMKWLRTNRPLQSARNEGGMTQRCWVKAWHIRCLRESAVVEEQLVDEK